MIVVELACHMLFIVFIHVSVKLVVDELMHNLVLPLILELELLSQVFHSWSEGF